MEIRELQKIIQESGVVGAGGAGFPTYVKIDERANTILMNCAECEPLLKLHRQLLKVHAYEIMKTFHKIAEIVGAKEAIIGIKKSYKDTVNALQEHLEAFPGMRLALLDEVYPMGDEIVLIYEATGRVVRPGGLPIEEGVAVFNVETVYNSYLLHRNHLIVQRRIFVVFCQSQTSHQPLFWYLSICSGFLYRRCLNSLRRTNPCFFQSKFHVCQKRPGRETLRTCIHLAYTAGTAEVRINVWIHIPKISIRRRSHEQCRINRMTQIVSGAKVRTGTALTADRCCPFQINRRFSLFFLNDRMIWRKYQNCVRSLCHRLVFCPYIAHHGSAYKIYGILHRSFSCHSHHFRKRSP